jgi:hypothetical protein
MKVTHRASAEQQAWSGKRGADTIAAALSIAPRLSYTIFTLFLHTQEIKKTSSLVEKIVNNFQERIQVTHNPQAERGAAFIHRVGEN